MRRITNCLSPSLTTLCKRAIELESLTSIVQGYLPETNRVQCSVGSFNKGCLVLIARDPVWASELRYSLPGLRDHLRRHAGLHQLITIKINLALKGITLKPQSTQHTDSPVLSERTRQHIQASGDQCVYSPLKHALNRLGRHR